jgi:6-phosphogluconolactonase (cycloisomerase 2 family)
VQGTARITDRPGGAKEHGALMNRWFGAIRRSACAAVLGTQLCGLAGCGGSTYAPALVTLNQQQPARFAYVTVADVQGRQIPGAVYEYAVGPDGSLATLSTASVPTGVGPVAIAPDPSGRYVYVVNSGDGTLSQYAVGTDGQLSALSPASVSISAALVGFTRITGVAVDPSGHYLYVTVTGGDPAPATTLAQYSIGSDGTLAPLPAATQSLATFGGPLVIHPSGNYAYVAGITAAPDARISEYSRDASGLLTPLVPPTISNTVNATGIYVVPTGQAAYVFGVCIDSVCDGQISQYRVGVDGVLTATGNVAVTGSHVNPVAIVSDATGSNAYVLTNLMGVDTNIGAVYQYAIASTGALVPGTPASLSVASGAVALAIDGSHLYALSANAVGFASGSPPGGFVDHYVIASGGQLSAAGAVVVSGGRPTALALLASH